MTQNDDTYEIEDLSGKLTFPVLFVSTLVGRGIYTMGQAVVDRLSKQGPIVHVPIENMVPQNIFNEDVKHYQFISNKIPFLLYLIYTWDIFYYRKYILEKYFHYADLSGIEKTINKYQIKTVLCGSNRPAFWLSALKRRKQMKVQLWGVLAEYGRNLGWKHIFWEQMNGLFSPLNRYELDFPFPSGFQYWKIRLPARKEYYEIAKSRGNKDDLLIVCGFWGQGPIIEIIRIISKRLPAIKIYAVCGENRPLFERAKTVFSKNNRIFIYGIVDSMAPFLEKCGSIITKPGISTIVETHAAERKIFLLKGMPVAEDHNAYYAIAHFKAQWFSLGEFIKWYNAQ